MMSAGSADQAAGGGNGSWSRLPEWLRPRDHERRGRGELRIVEIFALVIVGLVLVVATVHDLMREVHIGDRLHADLVSWKELTYSPEYHNPLIEQDVKHYTSRDIVCANTEEEKPEGTIQICMVFTGPVRHGRREAKGGYYLVAKGTDIHKPVLNEPQYSYGCFGTAVTEGLCEGTRPPNGPDEPLHGGW